MKTPAANTPAKRGPKKGQTVNTLKTVCKVFEAREKLGLTQSDLARLSGVAQTSISRIEDGTQKNPTRQVMVRIARAIAEREAPSNFPNPKARRAWVEERGRGLLGVLFWE